MVKRIDWSRRRLGSLCLLVRGRVVFFLMLAPLRSPEPAPLNMAAACVQLVHKVTTDITKAKPYVQYPTRKGIVASVVKKMYSRVKKVIKTPYTVSDRERKRKGDMDELITNKYLSDSYVEAFAYLLAKKNNLCLGLYIPFLYISSLHWTYSKFDMKKESLLLSSMSTQIQSKHQH
ncbi:hypothetical protein IEQ34_017498 [Dendrobium chrysotoxum]|uniref:Uncharacterized protein n=1 Tax=Dendrobium chrysotoxum TaxID=161865 RepID=A0AAV7GBG9_DENCH|nr:hypothetical protein IEQ34_017498 [Dendrobium chrysotoxum]